MNKGDKIIASQLAGDFVLPKNKNKKLVWIAGGIGITPFRSMAKYLSDKNENRDVVLFYSNKIKEDIAYKNIFDEAARVGLKTVYTLTEEESLPADWAGERGYVSEGMLKKYVPNYMERTFYVSGPHSMVAMFRETLGKMGVRRHKIVSDYFPGFA